MLGGHSLPPSTRSPPCRSSTPGYSILREMTFWRPLATLATPSSRHLNGTISFGRRLRRERFPVAPTARIEELAKAQGRHLLATRPRLGSGPGPGLHSFRHENH
ncbi:hypothetical protein BC936DRAFT_144908 [Jimgerdemannia flammicorona]|uniref:Uncharacterized protein n=1 Tax=Jimgerdemannia flammicorona TaxID=994334 RepID=A0A433DBC6_9FUNG|nr:hypothetical protein BC936DRAFT_144908 [Jimgerdemannia flammicorona]